LYQRISRGLGTAIAVAMAACCQWPVRLTRRHYFPTMSGGEIQLALQKLNVLGRVLYLAAHPMMKTQT